jgi:hypothetical protein
MSQMDFCTKVEPPTPTPSENEPKVEKKPEPEHKEPKQTPSPKKRRGRFFKLMVGLCVFGSAVMVLEYMNLIKTDLRPRVKQEDKGPVFFDESKKDGELVKRGREERIRQMREVLQQELSTEFKAPPDGYDQKLIDRQKEIQNELENILKLSQIKEPEKYKKIADMIESLQLEIQATHDQQSDKRKQIEQELEKLDRLRAIIDTEINDLKRYYEEVDENLEEFRVSITFSFALRELAKIKYRTPTSTALVKN